MKQKNTSEEINATRELILDATQTIMLEEGYAAVSSRRVAKQGGLKSQLVHYHFGTMDELFLAVFNRSEADYYERHERALESPNPLQEFWRLNTYSQGARLMYEFSALANHRERIRAEIAGATKKARRMQTAFLEQALKNNKVLFENCPPKVLSLIIAGTALQLVSEKSMGVTEAHKETHEFVDQLITMMESSDKK